MENCSPDYWGIEKAYRDVAIDINVDPSTVQRTVDLFMQTGDVHKRSYSENFRNATLENI